MLLTKKKLTQKGNLIMEKKTMGGFIAALRKANGLTQRDLAEKLNVSDKAVSRWEREECAPDLMLIPAIAEIFDITTDELLSGGRISNLDCVKTEQKKEKQVRALANRELTKFKSLAIVSIGLSVLGVLLMFGITLAFIRPITAICVASICVLASVIVILIACFKLRETENNDEVLDESNKIIRAGIKNAKFNYCFASLFTATAVLLVCIPLVLQDWGDLTFLLSYYLFDLRKYLLVFLVALLAATLIRQIAVLADKSLFGNRTIAKLNIVHILTGIAAGACFLRSMGTLIASAVLILVMIIVVFIFALVLKKDAKMILVIGFRNILLIFDYMVAQMFTLDPQYDRTYVTTNGTVSANSAMLAGIVFAFVIVIIFHFIIKSIKPKNVLS